MNKIFIAGLFAAIILGIIFPFGDRISFVLTALLAILLFFNFYDIDFNFKHFIKKEFFIGLVFCLVVLPILVFFMTKSLQIEFRLGLFLIAVTPTAIGSSIIVKLVKGDVNFSVAYTVIYNFLSIAAYPVLLKIFFGNSEVAIPVTNIIINLSIIILIPFILATVLKKTGFINKIISRVSKFVSYFFLLVIYIAVSSSVQNLKGISPVSLIVIIAFTFAVALLYFLSGLILGKGLYNKKTMSISMGQKNTGLCILVTMTNFSPISAIPATIYIIVHHLINSVLIFIFNRILQVKTDSDDKSQDL